MKHTLPLSIFAASIAISGCKESDSSDKPATVNVSGDYSAVILQSDYGVGSNVAIADASDLSEIVENYYADTVTDYTLKSDGEYYYHIGRSDAGTISKYETSAPSSDYYGGGYTLTPAEQTSGSNTHDIGFLPNDLAVLTRYGQSSAWLIDRAAQNDTDFKVGEIDLSAYVASDDTVSPAPEMDEVVIYGKKAFITMQRQGTTESAYGLPRSAYVAVVDSDTQQEIDTGKGADGLKGIELNIANPINTSVYGSDLYVQGINYSAAYTGEYSGGLVRIDMTTYEQTIIFQPDNSTGSISDVAVIGGKVFVIVYSGWQNNSLAIVNNDGSLTVSDTYTGMYLTFIQEGPEGNLWLGRGADNNNSSALLKLSATDLSLIDSVETTLDPSAVVFVNN